MFTAANVPMLLQSHPRWVLWELDGNGKKAPRSTRRPERPIDGTKPANWSTFAQAVEQATKQQATKQQVGIGFALGSVQGGPHFAGIDLDNCRNPNTGQIEPWAQRIIDYFDSYTEISPSGTGVKIFVLGSLADGARQGKVYQLELYDRDRYFTVTGNHVPNTPTTIEARDQELRELHDRVWRGDLRQLVHLFGFVLSETPDWVNLRCPWESHHSSGNQERDAGLKLADGKVVGFNCFHAGCADKSLSDVRALFGLKGGNAHDFAVDHTGKVIARSQENIRRAIALLGAKLEHDVFASKLYLTTADGRRPLDDQGSNRLYLVIEEAYKFSPPADYYKMVVQDHACANPVHPVRAYLDGLTWDGAPRLDTWLVTYGGATDTAFVRAAGAKTLIAAVRRARTPGAKHDEMLVLESDQGKLKSSALATLCPNPDWFSDDLPLNVDAKQVIERTSGKWLIEASDLYGMRRGDVEHLKAMLSRGVDGPVRMAYGHFPQERPRSFVIIGTTNSNKYLKDPTGNRRFWPIQVRVFDVDALRRDRDQLWAEAAAREAQGESNRLERGLWASAGEAQAERQLDDAWVDVLSEFLGLEPPDADPERPTCLPYVPKDRVLVSQVWDWLSIPVSARDERAVARLEAVMQMLGYEKKQNRGPSEADKKSAKRWCRVEKARGDD